MDRLKPFEYMTIAELRLLTEQYVNITKTSNLFSNNNPTNNNASADASTSKRDFSLSAEDIIKEMNK